MSALGQGFADSLSDALQRGMEQRRKREEDQRKLQMEMQLEGYKNQLKQQDPSSILQSRFLQAIGSQFTSHQQAQQVANPLERQAAQGAFGQSPDLNALISQTPQGQATDFIQSLKNAGISGLGAEGIKFQSGGGTIPLVTFNPDTGQFITSGTTPRGTQVRNIRPSLESEEERQMRLATARTAGKGLSTQESGQLENFSTAIDSIDKISKNLTGPQGGINNLLQASIPFSPKARGLAFELKNVSDILLRMRSGAQINEREYNRLRSLLPVGTDVIFGEPGVIQEKLSTFKRNFQNVLERQKQRGFSPIGSTQSSGSNKLSNGVSYTVE